MELSLLEVTQPERTLPTSPPKGKEKDSLSPRSACRVRGLRAPPRRHALCTASKSHPKNSSSLHSCDSRENVLSGRDKHVAFLLTPPAWSVAGKIVSDLCAAVTLHGFSGFLLRNQHTEKNLLAGSQRRMVDIFGIGSVTLGMPLASLCGETWDLMRASLSSPNVLKVYSLIRAWFKRAVLKSM